jgi:glucosyl-3-phosphoglycerate synthase
VTCGTHGSAVTLAGLITFAVVGHNEAATLRYMLDQAAAAVRPGDRLWFVDSASDDGSPELAARLGAEVLRAPLGKGRAMAAAVERCETSHICFLDADVLETTRNVPLTLREGLERSTADMVVAEFVWPAKGSLVLTTTIWRPLVGDLFPDALGTAPRFPLSGFRLLDVELARGPLPSEFGVETYLNLIGAIDGRTTATVDVGVFVGLIRPHPSMFHEVAETILDLAEARGRLDPAARRSWDVWVDETVAVISECRSGDGIMAERFAEELATLAARPRPSRSLNAGVGASGVG